MAINLAKKASEKTADRFKLASVTEGLFTAEYNWTGVATVQVYTIDNLPLQTYNRAAVSGSRFGNLTEVGDTVQEMTVEDEPCFNGAIDKSNNTSQLQIKAAGKVLRQNVDEVIIPYVDAYRLDKLATGAGIKQYSVSFTKSTAMEKIALLGAAMSNAKVPKEGRVLYIGETAAVQMKLADQVVGLEVAGAKAIVNGVCGMIDGNQVKVVPDSYLPTGVVFMIVKKGVAVAPKKVETFRIITDDKDIDGSIVQGHLLQDCFVLEAKENGIGVAYSTADPDAT